MLTSSNVLIAPFFGLLEETSGKTTEIFLTFFLIKDDTFGLKGQGRESKVTMLEKQGRKDKLPGKIER
jgi:hypothetical protein